MEHRQLSSAPKEPDESNNRTNESLQIIAIDGQVAGATIHLAGIVVDVDFAGGAIERARGVCQSVDEPQTNSGRPIATQIADCVQQGHVRATNARITHFGEEGNDCHKHTVQCHLMETIENDNDQIIVLWECRRARVQISSPPEKTRKYDTK